VTAGVNNVVLEGKSAELVLSLAQMLSPSALWQYFSANSGTLFKNNPITDN